MGNRFLPAYALVPNEYGWTRHFPNGSYYLFGKETSLEIHTRLVPNEPKVLPEVSKKQAVLMGIIAEAFPEILKRAQAELTACNQTIDPNFFDHLRHPHVWLTSENTDELSWTFVVERTDNPDFGYHLEFRGAEFLELWAGD